MLIEKFLKDAEATLSLGQQLGKHLLAANKSLVIYLEGQLGAGKTTFTGGILNGLGHSGAVKSPTYTLVEPYEELVLPAYHFDLYRLGDPEELEYIGIRDYFDNHALCLVEWPKRGAGFLPESDIVVQFSPMAMPNDANVIGRKICLTANTQRGEAIILALS